MNVEKLTCFHFRNYETMSFSFVPKCIHFLYGKNAQGKTNLIEAIYFLSHLRSFRTNQMDSMIMHGCNEFCVQAIVESNHRKEELKVIVDHQKSIYFVFKIRLKNIQILLELKMPSCFVLMIYLYLLHLQKIEDDLLIWN